LIGPDNSTAEAVLETVLPERQLNEESGNEIVDVSPGMIQNAMPCLRRRGSYWQYCSLGTKTRSMCASVADPGKAKLLLDGNAEFDLLEMCRSAWNWQEGSPHGFDGQR
jgi:hypothetical protein